MARRQVSQLDAPAVEEGVGADEEGVGPLARERCEGCIDLPAGAGVEDLDLHADGARSRLHVSSRWPRRLRSVGLTSTATRAAAGHQLAQEFQAALPPTPPTKKLMPVRFPPGRARLATRPSLTGSSPTTKTMGIVVVAALAADAARMPPIATITATWRRTSSAASAGSRSIDSPPSDIRSLRSRPRHSRSPSGPAEMRARGPRTRHGDAVSRNPITGIAGCCARAASGHATAAPPSSVMNSRRCSGRDVRFIARPPHRTVRAAFPHTAPTSGV